MYEVPEIQVLLSVVRSLCASLPGAFHVHHVIVHTFKVSDLCVCSTSIWRDKNTPLYSFFKRSTEFLASLFCLEVSGMYLCWGVCGPARCSLCFWWFCRRCRVHLAMCKLSPSRPSSGQTGRCMTSSASWQPTNHTLSALIKCVTSWLHHKSPKRNPYFICSYSKYAVFFVKTGGVFKSVE